jgi:hypothetical protein
MISVSKARKKLKSGIRKGCPTNVSVKTEIRNSNNVKNDLKALYSGNARSVVGTSNNQRMAPMS